MNTAYICYSPEYNQFLFDIISFHGIIIIVVIIRLV